MKNALLITLGIVLSACTPAPSVAEESGLLQSGSSSSSKSVAATSYEGESTMYVYEVFMNRQTNIPEGARFDTTFTVKNGEPIIKRERFHEYDQMLNPDLTRLGGLGTGGLSLHGFYYDFDCTEFVDFDDIAVKDLSLFYYVS